MNKKKMVSLILIVAFIVTPVLSLADHRFLETITTDTTPAETDALFNGAPWEQIVCSYDLYNRGYVSGTDLFDYWNRLFLSIEGGENLKEYLAQIREIDDPEICLLKNDADLPVKISALSDLCIH